MNNNGNIYRPKKTPLIIGGVLLVFVIAIIALTAFLIMNNDPKPPVSSDKGSSTKPQQTVGSSADPTPITADPTVPATSDPTAPISSGSTTTAQGGSTTPSITVTKPVYNKEPVKPISVDKEAVDIYRGALLLIDQNHGYNIDPAKLIKKSEMSKLSDEKVYSEYGFLRITGSPYFLLKSNSFYLQSEAASAFVYMMNTFAAETGNTDVQLRNAYYYDQTEEVHFNSSGLYVDLEINRDGKLYPLNYQPFRSDYYSWFIDNCHRFGFIHVRNVKNSSGIDQYTSLRYIGVPHATYMHDHSMSFDMYLAEVKKHPIEKAMTTTDSDGIAWQVYYVPATEGSTTINMNATDSSYTVSGNNTDGFIVTINTAYFE